MNRLLSKGLRQLAATIPAQYGSSTLRRMLTEYGDTVERMEGELTDLRKLKIRITDMVIDNGCTCFCKDDPEDDACHHDHGHGESCDPDERCEGCRLTAALNGTP
jgi:hypothetical protein